MIRNHHLNQMNPRYRNKPKNLLTLSHRNQGKKNLGRQTLALRRVHLDLYVLYHAMDLLEIHHVDPYHLLDTTIHVNTIIHIPITGEEKHLHLLIHWKGNFQKPYPLDLDVRMLDVILGEMKIMPMEIVTQLIRSFIRI